MTAAIRVFAADAEADLSQASTDHQRRRRRDRVGVETRGDRHDIQVSVPIGADQVDVAVVDIRCDDRAVAAEPTYQRVSPAPDREAFTVAPPS